jgi:hypothetical protein
LFVLANGIESLDLSAVQATAVGVASSPMPLDMYPRSAVVFAIFRRLQGIQRWLQRDDTTKLTLMLNGVWSSWFEQVGSSVTLLDDIECLNAWVIGQHFIFQL